MRFHVLPAIPAALASGLAALTFTALSEGSANVGAVIDNPTIPTVTAQGCANPMEGTTTAYFEWDAASVGGPQWLDLSLYNNGFAPGTFVTLALPPTSQENAFWTGLLHARRHYVRVNTLAPDGTWHPSPTGTFVTADCSRAAPASLIGVVQRCENLAITAIFSWFTAHPDGETWVDLSTQDNGFAPGTFLGGEPLPLSLVHSDGPAGPTYQDFSWSGLKTYTQHYWRVNTWTGTTWLTSATGTFYTTGSLIREDGTGACVLQHGDFFGPG